jgi:hypothetical protein
MRDKNPIKSVYAMKKKNRLNNKSRLLNEVNLFDSKQILIRIP